MHNKYQIALQKDYIETLFKESTNGREILNSCNDIYQKRVSVEDQYQKQLFELTQLLGKNSYSQNIQPFLNLQKKDLLNKIEDSKKLCQIINENMHKLNYLLQAQNKNVRPLFDGGRTLKKQLIHKKGEIDRLYQSYTQKKLECNQHQIQQFSQSCISDISYQKRNELVLKSDRYIRNILDMESQLQQLIHNYNTFLEGYHLRMKSIITELKDQEINRFNLIKEITQSIISESIDYNKYEANVKLFEQEDGENVLKEFVSYQNFINESIKKTEMTWYTYLDYYINHQLVHDYRQILALHKDQGSLSIHYAVLKKSIDELKELIYQKNAQFVIAIEYMIKKIRKDMNFLWNGKDTNIQEMAELMAQNQIGRFIWIQELSNFRLSQQFELSESAYDKLINLLNEILSLCLIEYDAYIVRKLIHMSLTFFKIDGNQNKVFLHEGIISHPIFKSLDLWDSIYFESLFEEMKKQENFRQNEETQDSIQREKNTIFGFLASLVQNMLTFGQDKLQVKILLQKYGKIYLLPDSQMKSLLQITEGINSKLVN